MLSPKEFIALSTSHLLQGSSLFRGDVFLPPIKHRTLRTIPQPADHLGRIKKSELLLARMDKVSRLLYSRKRRRSRCRTRGWGWAREGCGRGRCGSWNGCGFRRDESIPFFLPIYRSIRIDIFCQWRDGFEDIPFQNMPLVLLPFVLPLEMMYVRTKCTIERCTASLLDGFHIRRSFRIFVVL